MEEIIVTYVTQSNEEIDIAIPNSIQTAQVIESILYYEKIDLSYCELYEIRITRDKEEWVSVKGDETLQDYHVWDGFYITLHKKGALIPSFEMVPQEEPKEKLNVQTQSAENDEAGYVWKLIE